MSRITYIPNRIIDTDGISDGAVVHVYQAGTTTPISLYSDNDYTIPLSNPFTVAVGAEFPAVYYNYTGDVRLYIVSLTGDIQDEDPYVDLIDENNVSDFAPALVASRTELAALPAVAGRTVYLTEAGIEGHFTFRAGDYSAEVAEDTKKGVYVAPTTDATGATGSWIREVGDVVELEWFDAVGDGTTSDHVSANVASTIASMLSKPLQITNSKTFIVESDNNYATADGLYIPAPVDGGPTVVYGGGRIKRKAVSAGQMKNGARVMTLQAIQNGDYIIDGLTVDGNEANVPYDAANPYQYEQSACIAWRDPVGGVTTLGTVVLRNVVTDGAVGDGIFLNFPAKRVIIENPVGKNRTRRTRSCIQLNNSNYTFVRNADVINLESEPTAAPPVDNLLLIDGAIIHGSLDLAGYDTSNRWNVDLRGIRCVQDQVNPDQRFGLSCLNGTATNCDFRPTDMTRGSSRIYACSITVEDGNVTIPVNPADATQAIPLEIQALTTTDVVKFVRTKFNAPAGITSVAGYTKPAAGGGGTMSWTGGYVFPNYNSTTGSERVEFIDCDSDGNLPYFALAYRAGTMVLRGGRLFGKTGRVRYTSGGGFTCNLIIDDPHRWVSGSSVPLITFSGAAGTGTVSVKGMWDGELMAATTDGTNPVGVIYNIDATILVDSTPASRIRGLPRLRATLRSPASLTQDGWVYRNGSTPGATSAWETLPIYSGYGTSNIGYSTGAGGVQTQATNKSTGVTLNKLCGEITMNAAALAANTAVTFTLTNSTIALGDRIIVNHVSGGTFGAYCCDARAAAGSATVMVRNLTAGSLSEAIVLGFTVVKGATS